jgi:hypothetical protein
LAKKAKSVYEVINEALAKYVKDKKMAKAIGLYMARRFY